MIMEIKTPVLILNYKTYKLATGENAVKLSKIADSAAVEYNVEIIIAPQFTDIYRIAQEVDIAVFSQHIDPDAQGRATGHIIAEAIKDAGAVGTLLNHAEHKLESSIVEKTYKRIKELGIVSCICAESVKKAKELTKFGPEYIAFEIPELIGTGKSISTFSPDKVKESVKKIEDVNKEVVPLTGAGISNGDDVYASLKLGAKGALVASAVANSKEPKIVLNSMCEAMVKFMDEQ
jgi:triosephosphate isomerase